MGPLHEAVTWCKICPAGWQATHWDIYNKEKSCLAGRNRFVYGGCGTLLSSSMTGFVPCDSIYIYYIYIFIYCFLSFFFFK